MKTNRGDQVPEVPRAKMKTNKRRPGFSAGKNIYVWKAFKAFKIQKGLGVLNAAPYSTLFSASTGLIRFRVRSVMILTIRENPSDSAAEIT